MVLPVQHYERSYSDMIRKIVILLSMVLLFVSCGKVETDNNIGSDEQIIEKPLYRDFSNKDVVVAELLSKSDDERHGTHRNEVLYWNLESEKNNSKDTMTVSFMGSDYKGTYIDSYDLLYTPFKMDRYKFEGGVFGVVSGTDCLFSIVFDDEIIRAQSNRSMEGIISNNDALEVSKSLLKDYMQIDDSYFWTVMFDDVSYICYVSFEQKSNGLQGGNSANIIMTKDGTILSMDYVSINTFLQKMNLPLYEKKYWEILESESSERKLNEKIKSIYSNYNEKEYSYRVNSRTIAVLPEGQPGIVYEIIIDFKNDDEIDEEITYLLVTYENDR